MSPKKPRANKNTSCTPCNVILILTVVLLFAVLMILTVWIAVGNIAARITVEAGTLQVDASDYILWNPVHSASFITDIATIDLCQPGLYPVQIYYCGRTYNRVLQVQDTICPTAVLMDLSAFSVNMPDAADFIVEIQDATNVTVMYVLEPDMNTEGTQTVELLLTDEGGNTTVLQASLTVIIDTQAPVIYGVHSISLYVGSTVSYRSGILLEDDVDEDPTLTIDSSLVDLSQPGTYEVTYIATDAAGNIRSTTTEVVVEAQPSTYVDEATIYAAADDILAQIITADMTNEKKVEAIYGWVTGNCYYTSYADKTDWLQAAYRMLSRHTGNCFGFYAVSKLFFDRLGFPNMMVQRVINDYRPYNHYWNLVSIDGGETYYHYDATPRSPSMGDMYLLTDADLDYFDQYYIRGYYTRDTSLYPATPEE